MCGEITSCELNLSNVTKPPTERSFWQRQGNLSPRNESIYLRAILEDGKNIKAVGCVGGCNFKGKCFFTLVLGCLIRNAGGKFLRSFLQPTNGVFY
jgi:hypothetical protein